MILHLHSPCIRTESSPQVSRYANGIASGNGGPAENNYVHGSGSLISATAANAVAYSSTQS